MKKIAALSISTALLLAACSSTPVEDYSANKPELDIRDYFNGNLDAWGMFVSRAGKADPMFEVKLKGAWEGNSGTLKEHFIYADGHTQDRVWTLAFSDDHHFTGTAPDVIGTAEGTQFGNAVEMKYVLTVQTDSGSSYDMTMDDWLYKMNGKLVINRNEMTKFGLKTGELIISFDKAGK